MHNFKRYEGNVILADNKHLDIIGVGDVVLKTTLVMKWTLKNVKFIPYLKRMLILVGKLNDEGHHIKFGDRQWKTMKGNLEFARGMCY